MLENEQAQAASHVDRMVGAVVIDQDADVHQLGEFSYRGLEGFLRVVGGHDDGNAFSINHSCLIILVRASEILLAEIL